MPIQWKQWCDSHLANRFESGVAPETVEVPVQSTAPDDKEHGNDLGVPQLTESAGSPTEEEMKARIVEGREYIKQSTLKSSVSLALSGASDIQEWTCCFISESKTASGLLKTFSDLGQRSST